MQGRRDGKGNLPTFWGNALVREKVGNYYLQFEGNTSAMNPPGPPVLITYARKNKDAREINI